MTLETLCVEELDGHGLRPEALTEGFVYISLENGTKAALTKQEVTGEIVGDSFQLR